jgi:hypothetical protein
MRQVVHQVARLSNISQVPPGSRSSQIRQLRKPSRHGMGDTLRPQSIRVRDTGGSPACDGRRIRLPRLLNAPEPETTTSESAPAECVPSSSLVPESLLVSKVQARVLKTAPWHVTYPHRSRQLGVRPDHAQATRQGRGVAAVYPGWMLLSIMGCP